MQKINKLFAFVAENDETREGIIGAVTDMGTVSMVCADLGRLEEMKKYAVEAANATGKTIKLIVFTTREELEIIHPAIGPNTF